MSIGEIITTPTGLAVIVELRPTSFKVGGTGPVVGEVIVPVPEREGTNPYRSLTAQAATAYLSPVGEPVQVPPPIAHAVAARAYQSTLLRAVQPSPLIVLLA